MQGSALITGAAKRIGRAIALKLAHRGWNIALHYNTSRQEAEKTASEVRTLGVRCETVRCDLSDMRAVGGLIPGAMKACPDLNMLVNNASIFQRGPLLETDEALLDRHLAINLKAPLILTRDFARLCKRGQVVNILDTKVTKAFSVYFAYALAKKGLYEMTLMAAMELGPAIRVNGVCPGLILPPEGQDMQYLQRLAQKVPLRRPGSPEDVAAAVAFLAESDYITGEIIRVDGGEHLV